MAEIYNRTLVETKAAMLLIPQSARVLAKNSARHTEKGWPRWSHPSCSLLLHELTLARAVVATVATYDRPCGECMPGHRSVRQRL